jgi:hypothetical protein
VPLVDKKPLRTAHAGRGQQYISQTRGPQTKQPKKRKEEKRRDQINCSMRERGESTKEDNEQDEFLGQI